MSCSVCLSNPDKLQMNLKNFMIPFVNLNEAAQVYLFISGRSCQNTSQVNVCQVVNENILLKLTFVPYSRMFRLPDTLPMVTSITLVAVSTIAK